MSQSHPDRRDLAYLIERAEDAAADGEHGDAIRSLIEVVKGQRMRWGTTTQPGRVPPRECIRAARDALNKAYSHPGVTEARHALPFIAEAVDWQRRALEQIAESSDE
jgi:hypothetical protein